MKSIFSKIMLLCLCLFTACASEEEEFATKYGDPVKVRFELSAAEPAPMSRANTGQYVAEVEPWELIHSYRVVITDNAGKIVALVDKTFADDTSVEYDPVDLELRSGSYKAYGFANIDFTYLNNLGITKGAAMPNLAELRYFVEGYGENYFNGETLLPMSAFEDTGKYIPMTSLNGQSVTVTERVNQTFGIEVRRLFAKLEFAFRNESAKALNLNSLSVSDLTINKIEEEVKKPAIFLMNHEDQGTDLCYLPTTYAKATQKHNYGTSPLVIPIYTGAADQVKTECFYVLESKADAVTNSFLLDFNFTPTSGSWAESEKERFALTDPNSITLIHRNDWIKIPIVIGDWLFKLEVFCYPPIGGYPEAEVKEDESNAFHVTFRSPGDIAFYPTLHKYYDDTEYFDLTDPRVLKSTDPISPKVTVTDPDGIFEKAPQFEAGELPARLRDKEGNAVVEISAKFEKVKGSGIYTEMTRKIYVTLKK